MEVIPVPGNSVRGINDDDASWAFKVLESWLKH